MRSITSRKRPSNPPDVPAPCSASKKRFPSPVLITYDTLSRIASTRYALGRGIDNA
jgi:hypothetical protein